jgi:hypothetical protein
VGAAVAAAGAVDSEPGSVSDAEVSGGCEVAALAAGGLDSVTVRLGVFFAAALVAVFLAGCFVLAARWDGLVVAARVAGRAVDVGDGVFAVLVAVGSPAACGQMVVSAMSGGCLRPPSCHTQASVDPGAGSCAAEPAEL